MYHSDGNWYEQIYDSSGNCINGTSLWGHWDNRWHYRYNGDVTLYAGWTPDNYTLTFDPNGGTLRNPGSNLYNPQWNNGNRMAACSNRYTMLLEMPLMVLLCGDTGIITGTGVMQET